jgi:hypothetical protein
VKRESFRLSLTAMSHHHGCALFFATFVAVYSPQSSFA